MSSRLTALFLSLSLSLALLASPVYAQFQGAGLLSEKETASVNQYYEAITTTQAFREDSVSAYEAIQAAEADASKWGELLKLFCNKLGALHGIVEEYKHAEKLASIAPKVNYYPMETLERARKKYKERTGTELTFPYTDNGKTFNSYADMAQYYIQQDTPFKYEDGTGFKLVPTALTDKGEVVPGIFYTAEDVRQMKIQTGTPKTGFLGFKTGTYTADEVREIRQAVEKRLQDPDYQQDGYYVFVHYRELVPGQRNKYYARLQKEMQRYRGELSIIRAFAEKNGLSLAGAKCAYPEDVVILASDEKLKKPAIPEDPRKDVVPITSASRP